MDRIDEARQRLAAATAREPNLTASDILPGPLRVMFEEGREKFMDGLRKAGFKHFSGSRTCARRKWRAAIRVLEVQRTYPGGSLNSG